MDIENLIEQLRYLADTPSYTAFHDAKEREIICDQCEADFCYDKQQDAHWCMYEALSRAATALSTLQAENEKLKDQLYDGEGVNLVNYWMQQAKIEENGHRNCQAENEKLRAELEQVKWERDAAVSDLETIMAYNSDTCQFCKNGQCYVRGGTKSCLPKWRGQKEE